MSRNARFRGLSGEKKDLFSRKGAWILRRCALFARKNARGREARRKGLVGKIEVSTRESKSPY